MSSLKSDLRNDILKTIVYFEIFEYPLTVEQIFSFLPQKVASVAEIMLVVDTLVLEGKLSREKQYYFLPSNDKRIVEKRLLDEKRAKRMLSYARIISGFIKRFPYVRGIFITGSLSKDVAASSSDIDFMIVAAPERLWICKTFLSVFRKIFLFDKSKYFCTNFYVTKNGYSLDRRNYYTAIEVATTKVIWNENAFNQFQNFNKWTNKYLPNITVNADKNMLIFNSRSILQRLLELMLNIFPMQSLNHKLMEFNRARREKAFKHIDQKQFDSKFIISPDVSSVWPDDRQEPVLKKFQNKISLLGIR
jgi:hypothetical protein